MKNIALALLALVLLPATVFAGGGSKNSTEIVIKNNSTDIAFVIVDTTLTDTQLAALPDPAAFTAAGGIILQPGASSKALKVKAGNHTVKAVFTNGMAPPVLSEIATATINAVANKKTNVAVSGNVGAAPTIVVVP